MVLQLSSVWTLDIYSVSSQKPLLGIPSWVNWPFVYFYGAFLKVSTSFPCSYPNNTLVLVLRSPLILMPLC